MSPPFQTSSLAQPGVAANACRTSAACKGGRNLSGGVAAHAMLDFLRHFGILFNVATDFLTTRLPEQQAAGDLEDPVARPAAMTSRDNMRLREMRDMPTGTVKWFNATKGYGFIAPDDGGKDVFVHISAVERAGLTGLADNQKIGYELQSGRDGRSSASDLRLL
jgi:CspA family cold shock protein